MRDTDESVSLAMPAGKKSNTAFTSRTVIRPAQSQRIHRGDGLRMTGLSGDNAFLSLSRLAGGKIDQALRRGSLYSVHQLHRGGEALCLLASAIRESWGAFGVSQPANVSLKCSRQQSAVSQLHFPLHVFSRFSRTKSGKMTLQFDGFIASGAFRYLS